MVAPVSVISSRFDGSCQDSAPEAIIAFLDSSSYEGASVQHLVEPDTRDVEANTQEDQLLADSPSLSWLVIIQPLSVILFVNNITLRRALLHDR